MKKFFFPTSLYTSIYTRILLWLHSLTLAFNVGQTTAMGHSPPPTLTNNIIQTHSFFFYLLSLHKAARKTTLRAYLIRMICDPKRSRLSYGGVADMARASKWICSARCVKREVNIHNKRQYSFKYKYLNTQMYLMVRVRLENKSNNAVGSTTKT